MAVKLASSVPLLLLIVTNACLFGVHGGYGGGWTDAHATFYGGGDASGTMGEFTIN